ncbi:hypothetical protein PSDVSF_24270 [Pseudodesulfovibrio sediminis]|uniref:Class I SAM-dependent methyltransferase n=2 Tax=Pseudodesulfovibrio sediminis TaxID=2810563 RepID=A0ABM7P880_9BACT|nr:hypothetical protein PSDVSF_24270 [Pseudodesulfovibrio sediminis]
MKLEDIRPDGPMFTLLSERRKMIELGSTLFATQPELFSENLSCPLCGSTDREEFGAKGYTRFMRCRQCEMLYLEHEPKDSLRFSNITASPAADAAVETVQVATFEARKKKKFEPILNRLLQDAHSDQPLRILDIGCGSGYFLELVRERTSWQAVGLEMNSKAIEIGRAHGLDIVKGSLEAYKPEEPFDIVVCVGVLAHISNPKKLAMDLGRMVRKNGFLLVRTPNYQGFEYTMLGMSHSHFDPMECIHSFNPVSIAELFRAGGFETVEVTTPGLLDVDVVRQHLRIFPETFTAGPFESQLLYDDSSDMDATRRVFSRFLAGNFMSGLMQAVARKVTG